MSESFKYLLIVLAVIGQLSGIVLSFIKLEWALMMFSVYGIALIVLLVVFILDRKKEKKEEINYDDCDY
ncbi:hypothetical protein [Halalkalibacter nanhaiisediminis]|uniref:Uncharacterized protein n=1 Tax=Halalkalibacter nanhaiisediminis TaxID=688079 RepID=A0A562QGY8_9BACI|nr:hypothetical protein [Halalkalibacter nanhaiisediminis]TWI56018.1 hypothetical protein IQ10_02623 [Halalkalibacter nanhaiisediminis]